MADARINIKVDVDAKGAQSALDKTARRASKIKKAGFDGKAGLDGLRKSAEAVQGPLGGVTSRAIAAGEAVVKFGSALGPAGVAVGIFAVGLLAPAGAVAAMTALTNASIESRDELNKYREMGAEIAPVNQDLAASVRQFETAKQDLSIATAKASEVLGAQFAPATALVTTALASAINQAADFGREMQDMHASATEAVPALNNLVDSLAEVSGLGSLTRRTALEATRDSMEGIREAHGRLFNDLASNALDEEWERITEELKKHNAESARAVKTTRELAAVSFEARNALAEMEYGLARTAESLGETQARFRAVGADIDSWILSIEAAQAQHASSALSVSQSFTSTLDSINAASAQKSVAVFRVTQGIRIAEAQISAIAAASAALANPPGPPFTVPMAAAAMAAGLANVAAIAAVPPPTFHTGGGMGRGGPDAPDEITARLRRNETVMTRQQKAEQGMGAPVIQVRFRHQTLDTMQADVLRNPASKSRRVVKGRRRSGHARRRG